jgi:hypothetical protein
VKSKIGRKKKSAKPDFAAIVAPKQTSAGAETLLLIHIKTPQEQGCCGDV